MLTLPISIVVLHFIGDFVLQSDWMALNKSKNWDALALHAYIYASVLGVYLGYTNSLHRIASYTFLAMFYSVWVWTIAVFVPHFITDAITSRITSKLWFIDLEPLVIPLEEYPRHTHYATVTGGKRHWFFVMIGLDQLIHYVTLAWTLKLLTGI